MKRTLISLLALSAMTAGALAQDSEVQPGLIYDLGGKFDKSFNEAAYAGAEQFTEETGVEYRDFEIQNDAQREQALRRFIRDGNNPIVTVGFNWSAAVEKIAPEYPETDFVVIDTVVDQPNVRSVVFREEQGSYLVGMLAAMASESGTVGFIGGMDVPLISKFSCGYKGGVKAVKEDATVLEAMTGTTPEAWNDPVRGAEIARSQISQGADVIYHAAGGTGVGILQAAADEGIYGIGVDSNQNALHPGSVLTSMVKRVDVAVYDAFMDAQNGEFEGGTEVLGLAEEGVGYAVDENNQELITEEMKTAVEEAKAQIIAGEIEVHDYMTDESCPY